MACFIKPTFKQFEKLITELLADFRRKGVDRIDPLMLFLIGFDLGGFVHRFHVRGWRTKEDNIARLLSVLTRDHTEALIAVDAELVIGIDQHWDLIGLAEQSPSVGIHFLPLPFGRLAVLFGVE